MADGFRILQAKLTPPRLPETITRERLMRRLSAMTEKKLTMVSAGAGFGKTTSIIQAGQRHETPMAWVGLDDNDKSSRVFIRDLIAAIQVFVPLFGNDIDALWDQVSGRDERPDDLLTALISNMEDHVKSPLILVLDDFHVIQDDNEILYATDVLLRYIPPHVHLVIISRKELPLNVSRLRALRQLQEIRESDLTFTPDEIKELFEKVFHVKMGPEQWELLHGKTGGWVSGLILFYHAIKDKKSGEIKELLNDFTGTHRLLAEYLEENVLASVSDETREFLIRTSILPRLESPVCDRFRGAGNSGEILRYLERNHLFTFSMDEEGTRFQYHPLFRDILKARLRAEFRHEEVRALHKQAAVLLEEQGDKEAALEHYLEAGETQEACRVMDAIAVRLVLEGRYRLIRSTLEKIPEEFLRNEAWYKFIRAGSLELSGKLREAAALYREALEAYGKRDALEYRALCLQSLARTYFLMGDLEKSEPLFEKLLESNAVTPFHPLGTLGYLVFISAFRGDLEGADRYYGMGKAVFSEGEGYARAFDAWLDLGLGARYYASGDFQAAMKVLEQAKDSFASYRPSRGHSVYYVLMASVCYRMGHFSRGLEFADEGLGSIKEKQYQDSAYGRLLLLGAVNMVLPEQWEEALSRALLGLAFFKKEKNIRGRVFAHMVLHILYLRMKDETRAEEQALEGIRHATGVRETVMRAELKRHLAELHIYQGETEKALPLLEEAEQALQHSKWDLCVIAVLRARAHLGRKNMVQALECLIEALTLAERSQYDAWISEQRDSILPLLIKAYSKGLKQGYIENVMRGIPETKIRRELKRVLKNGNPNEKISATRLLDRAPLVQPRELKITMLGTFKVMIGDQDVPAGDWRGTQPMALFKYLVYESTRGYVNKDALLELLWPEEDPARSGKRLNVLLALLRKTLEPARPKGVPSAYVLKSGDFYRIDVGEAGWIDIQRFKDAVSRARGESDPDIAILKYLKAESLYSGDFLEEDPYCEWCFRPREGLRRDYVRVLTGILDYYEKKDDTPHCILYAEKCLEVDAYDEALYRRLMRHYKRAGNQGMVVRTFQRCREHIEQSLHCTLTGRTQRLYEELVSS